MATTLSATTAERIERAEAIIAHLQLTIAQVKGEQPLEDWIDPARFAKIGLDLAIGVAARDLRALADESK